MNEEKLKKILSDSNVPPYDKNAKKRAMNVAMAEFDAVQTKVLQKNHKKSQGLSFLSRLINSLKQDNRNTTMKKSWVYGGLATTMVAVLAIFINFSSLQPLLNQNDQEVFSEPAGQKPDSSIALSQNEALLPRNRSKKTGKKRETVKLAGEIAKSKTTEVNKLPLKDRSRLNEKTKASHLSQLTENDRSDQLTKKPNTKRELVTNSVVKRTESITSMTKSLKETLGTSNNLARFAPQPSGDMAIPSKSVAADSEQVRPIFQQESHDKFEKFAESPIKQVSKQPVSTFSIDVDTAAYSFVRKSLNAGRLPPKDAVRIEEMVNYFDYAWPKPSSKEIPFKSTIAVTPSPWTSGNKLIHIGIKGFEITTTSRPRTNLVFLLDVSGSMNAPGKLPLVKNSMRMLLDNLQPDDTVAIAVYAGAAGTVLEPTPVKQKAKILTALERLSAGGSTAGAHGIKLAYDLAEANFDKKAVNRIVLATDGDFNVGITNTEGLKGYVERKRKSGVFLSVLGFGRGNWNDQLMQALAQNGNGVAAYIDTLSEAQKVLVKEASSVLFPIAKDVKIQVEFNPQTVAEYRLVGYETRALKREDFNNDAVDAGDIGAGHTITAIYEITPKGAPGQKNDGSRYKTVETNETNTSFSHEYAFLKIRYKLPDSDTSTLLTEVITTQQEPSNPVITNEVITLPQSGRLDGCEQPQGLPMLRFGGLLKVSG
ncbi:MAG: VWA domain-containing protein [Methylococcaceae bacterium]